MSFITKVNQKNPCLHIPKANYRSRPGHMIAIFMQKIKKAFKILHVGIKVRTIQLQRAISSQAASAIFALSFIISKYVTVTLASQVFIEPSKYEAASKNKTLTSSLLQFLSSSIHKGLLCLQQRMILSQEPNIFFKMLSFRST